MKNFKSVAFTAIALGTLIFPVGCVTKPAGNQMPPPDSAELKLARAVHDKDSDSAKSWVKQNISVNATESYAGRWAEPSGWSAAMWSVWHWVEDKPLCAYVMHSNGEFGQKQKDALLEHAARVGDIGRAKVFIELGANPNYTNAFGENCATLALRYFRGQYGIDENSAALPRYGDLEEVNAAVKLNVENEAAAKKHLEEIQKVVDDYKKRAEAFAKSPQESANAQLKFAKTELETALEFYKKDKGLKPEDSVPADYASAAQVYGELLDDAANKLSICEKNLRYVRFIELLKNSGANLRKLLAGKQDNSGKQDKWKGQQDKWTMDAAARRGIYSAFPLVVDGLWDGELTLIQLIGRGSEIYTKQVLPYTLPTPKEVLFMWCLNSAEFEEAQKQGRKAVEELALSMMKQARTTYWHSAQASMKLKFGGVGVNDYYADGFGWGLGGSLSGGAITSYTGATEAEKEEAFAHGANRGVELGRVLGAIELAQNGDALFEEIRADAERVNASARERNAQIYALYEELPMDGELGEKWRGIWERRTKRLYAYKKSLVDRITPVLQTEAKILEKWLGNPVTPEPANGIGYEESERQAETLYQERKRALEKIRAFLSSDFFKETPVEELIANPPHPRDADPEWYAQNCLGKIKNTQIFIDAAKAILDYGTDVNARANGTDHPALVCAYLWDKPEFEKLLLSYGADKKLALFHICERNDFDLLKKILPGIKSLADVPADALGNTILHRAVLAGRADMIPEIVKRGVPVNVQNKHDDTPLHLAAEKEDEACVVSLLSLGANVNAKDKDDRKPFQRFWNAPNPKLLKVFETAKKKN